MSSIVSGHHTLASSNAEQISTDTTQYQSVVLMNRRIRSGSTEQDRITFGGPAVKAGQDGIERAAGDGWEWGASPHMLYRLSDLFAIGTSGDSIDYVCVLSS